MKMQSSKLLARAWMLNIIGERCGIRVKAARLVLYDYGDFPDITGLLSRCRARRNGQPSSYRLECAGRGSQNTIQPASLVRTDSRTLVSEKRVRSIVEFRYPLLPDEYGYDWTGGEEVVQV